MAILKKSTKNSKTLFVTSEYPGVTKSGGIGAAVLEAATILAENRLDNIIVVAIVIPNTKYLDRDYQKNLPKNIEFLIIESEKYYTGADNNESRSYAVMQALENEAYVNIVFPDYGGLAYYSLLAKKQGYKFLHTKIFIAVHGPSKWAQELNYNLCPSLESITSYFIEKRCLELSDANIFLSEYIKDWCVDNLGISFNKNDSIVSNLMHFQDANTSLKSKKRVDKLVFFGRHEPRKNISLFVDAIRLLAKQSKILSSTEIVFLGDLAEVDGFPSEMYIYQKLGSYGLNIKILPGLSRVDALHYLKQTDSSAVFIPSIENCPYTVLEVLSLKIPLYVLDEGGSRELIASKYHQSNLFSNNIGDLASKIEAVLVEGGRTPERSDFVKSARTHLDKIFFQTKKAEHLYKLPINKSRKLVSVVVTTFNRFEKAIEAINSVLAQSYKKLEIILVDDGSNRDDEKYQDLRNFCAAHGVLLVEQENKYLGAARNAGLSKASGQYILFLDDDDLLLPDAIYRLVAAMEYSKVDILTTLSYFLDHNLRGLAQVDTGIIKTVSYLPVGGPLEIAPFKNCFGSSMSLISRKVFSSGLRYTEQYGVGHEDYEFYINAVQKGFKLEVHPEPSFYYEIGVSSMISTTPISKNFYRSFSAINFGNQSIDSSLWSAVLLNSYTKNLIEDRAGSLKTLPEPLGSLYPQFKQLDSITRLKLIYKYGEYEKNIFFPKNISDSINLLDLLKNKNKKNIPIEKEKSIDIPHLVNMLVNSNASNASGVVISKITDSFNYSLDKPKKLTNIEVDYIIRAIDLTRSFLIAQAIADQRERVGQIIDDERRKLCLISIAGYMVSDKTIFRDHFLALLQGEANDFRVQGTHYFDMSPEKICVDVMLRSSKPDWAFRFTKIATSVISGVDSSFVGDFTKLIVFLRND